MKKNKNIIAALILSIVFTIFTWHKFLISGNSIIFLFILISSIIFIKFSLQNIDARIIKFSAIYSILFSIIEMLGTDINADYTLDFMGAKWLIIEFMGYSIIAFCIISNILKYNISNDNEREEKSITIWKKEFLGINKLSFFTNVILISLFWLPYLLKYFPGITTPDSAWQIEQALGFDKITGHHPVIHTLIISVFMNIGVKVFGSTNAGVCLYSIFSILYMAICDAIVLKYLAKKNVKKQIRIIILLFYMIYPVNAFYGITMWKDVLFSGIFPIMLILIYEITNNTLDFFKKKRNIIYFILVSLLTMLMRNNGFYCVALAYLIILIIKRKYWKKLLPLFFAIICSFEINNVILYKILKLERGSVAEMLSAPLQQIARVDKYYRDELSEKQIAEINSFFVVENIGDNYNPILSDNVKFKFNVEYFNNHKRDFINLWLQLFKKYRKDYIEAFICNSYGYYYIETQYAVVSRGAVSQANENRVDLGIYRNSIIEHSIFDKLDELIDRADVPITYLFFRPGFIFWIIISMLFKVIYEKEYDNIICYLTIFALWITVILSPVFCEYRYIYPLVLSLPVLAGIMNKKIKI